MLDRPSDRALLIDPIPFVKMHGIGNDYVYLDEREVEVDVRAAPRWARRFADRQRGVGGDGLIILRRGTDPAVRMEMYNADGSRSAMCGNGLRCVAYLAHRRGYSTSREFSIATDVGARRAIVAAQPSSDGSTWVEVDMGRPRIGSTREELRAGDTRAFGSVVEVGNPHFVIEIESALDSYPVAHDGALFERHARFATGANIEFVRVESREQIALRVWERGSGETLACGSGATAAVAVLAQLGRVDRRVRVRLPGGELTVVIADDGAATLAGPVAVSFVGACARELVAV
ncbi:MAG: diaminopimelate epimerase [Planctomycetota bacterium]